MTVPPDLVMGLLGSSDENLRALERLLAHLARLVRGERVEQRAREEPVARAGAHAAGATRALRRGGARDPRAGEARAAAAGVPPRAWGLKVENPQLWAGLSRAPEAAACFRAAQALLWGA